MDKRDERWGDMYACVSHTTVDDGDGGPLEIARIGIYVWYDEFFVYREQMILEEDFVDVIDDKIVFNWLMKEMIKMIDDDLDRRYSDN